MCGLDGWRIVVQTEKFSILFISKDSDVSQNHLSKSVVLQVHLLNLNGSGLHKKFELMISNCETALFNEMFSYSQIAAANVSHWTNPLKPRSFHIHFFNLDFENPYMVVKWLRSNKVLMENPILYPFILALQWHLPECYFDSMYKLIHLNLVSLSLFNANCNVQAL